MKAPFQTLILFSYTDKFGVICEDVMTKKHENLMIFQCFQQSDSPYLFYVTSLWNHKLVNVCWPSRSRSRSNRNFLTVACNCSILVIIIIYSVFSGPAFARENLRNRNAFSHQTSHTCRPSPLIVHLVFIEPIRITILDLEANPCFMIFLNISKTYHRSFNCDISKRRSGQELPFIFFELRALTYLWGRYDPKTENFTLFYIYLLHIHSFSKTFYILV